MREECDYPKHGKHAGGRRINNEMEDRHLRSHSRASNGYTYVLAFSQWTTHLNKPEEQIAKYAV